MEKPNKEFGSTASQKFAQVHETTCARILVFHRHYDGKWWPDGAAPREVFEVPPLDGLEFQPCALLYTTLLNY